jgi:hypothetical protein
LTDALTHMATGSETRSFCSVVCKQGFVPVGVDGSVKGWQEDFLTEIGLEDLVKDDFKRMGGVDKVVCPTPRAGKHKTNHVRTDAILLRVNLSALSARRLLQTWAFSPESP